MTTRTNRTARMLALAAGTALASTALAGCATQAAPRADLSASRADVAMQKGRAGDAVANAEAAVLADPRNAGYRTMLGAAYMKAGRFQSAKTSFDDAMALGDESARTVLGYALAQDVGKALNPALVEGQMRGGAAQGIGWALYEELLHDDAGQLLTGSFMTYALPTFEHVPRIDTLIVEVPAPDGPYGAKGLAEAPVLAAPPAIANAVKAAAGVRVHEMPLTPPRVFAALHANGG